MAPPFVPCADAAQISMGFAQADGSFAENTYWVKRSIAWDNTSLLAMCAAFKTWWTTGDGTHKQQAQMCTNYSLIQIAARDFTTQHSGSVVYQTGLPLAGTSAGTSVEQGLTFSVTARTGLAGKSYRGRTFLIGLNQSDLSNQQENLVGSGNASGYVSALNALITAVPAADTDSILVVMSRYYQPGGPGTDSVPRAAGIPTPILNFGFHDLLLDFQRRRAPAHGRHH